MNRAVRLAMLLSMDSQLAVAEKGRSDERTGIAQHEEMLALVPPVGAVLVLLQHFCSSMGGCSAQGTRSRGCPLHC